MLKLISSWHFSHCTGWLVQAPIVPEVLQLALHGAHAGLAHTGSPATARSERIHSSSCRVQAGAEHRGLSRPAHLAYLSPATPRLWPTGWALGRGLPLVSKGAGWLHSESGTSIVGPEQRAVRLSTEMSD